MPTARKTQDIDLKIAKGLSFKDIGGLFKKTELIFAFIMLLIISIMIMPIPSILMDFCLAISITFSILIMMTSLFIERPLDFSSFPIILLVSTMIRLSLNIASTRLILSHGHEGPHAAGKVIEAFGEFVMGGNFIIGIIVFSILIIVNFVVITKGSGRIAEVSARFSLDAMPGKQMAIDADLSSGLLDEITAKKRRKELERESSFYGAMDGAAKFVRGDAIAGLLITFINIIGGMIIGVAQNNLTLAIALKSYTILTVGDGLVTQIPALIVSTAAGLLVSRGGEDGATNKAVFQQLSAFPKALGMCSFLMAIFTLLPGTPSLPFLSLSILMGLGAWTMNQKQKALLKKEEETKKPKTPSDQDSSVAPPIDLIRIELGHNLLSLLNKERSIHLSDQIRFLRTQMAKTMGIILPSMRLQDNLRLEANEYVIYIKELEAGKGALRPDSLLVMNPSASPITLPGESTKEPTFGLAAMWVSPEYQTQAEALHYTIVDPCIVLTTHLSEIVKDYITDLLTYADVQNLLDNLEPVYKKLLQELTPSQVSIGNIQRILQNLVAERVSIRDLPTILEGIFEASATSRHLTTITEYVRSRLARQITFSHMDDNGTIAVLTLSPKWEENFMESLLGEGEQRQLTMSPNLIQDFIQRVRQVYERYQQMGENPCLIVNPTLRPHLRSILERSRPSTIVLSQNDVHLKAKIRHIGHV